MDSYKRLLLANKAFVQEKLAIDSAFFESREKTQTPEFLWIGCSDSRVPAEEVTGTEPGELFVHRNIANMVVHTDLNLLSVLQYAVEHLEVKHIIVCGHYGCGGVKTALSNKDFGLLNKWLRHIKDVHRLYNEELNAIADPVQKFNRLVELNTIESVHHLTETSIVQRRWKTHNEPLLHGWVYDMKTGLLKQLQTVKPGSRIEEIYMYDLE